MSKPLTDRCFSVTGDSGDAYEITITNDSAGQTMHCSCPAGQIGTLCKHRMRLLTGDLNAVRELSEADTQAVQALAENVRLRPIIDECHEIEQAIETLKARGKIVKRQLARLLNTGI